MTTPRGLRTTAMIAFQDITKRYPDGTLALQGVSLEVPAGQFCVVLGPSGSGKSTLLRLVNGMHQPTHGTLSVDGRPLTRRSLPAIQPRVAMIHQQFHLVDRLNVLDNVLSGALPTLSLPRALLKLFPTPLQRRACKLLAEVGLGEEHLSRRAMELSGGQQQRVAIARAFILSPAVVLADEPVASLDPRISEDILTLLKTASQQYGATVLCSLHQVDLARRFADRVVGMRDGHLVYDGDASLHDDALNKIYGPTRSPSDAPPSDVAHHTHTPHTLEAT